MAASTLTVLRKGHFPQHGQPEDVPGYTGKSSKWAVVQVELGSVGGPGATVLDCDLCSLLGWEEVLFASIDPVFELSNVPVFIYFAPTTTPYTHISLVEAVSATTHKPELSTIQQQIEYYTVRCWCVGF